MLSRQLYDFNKDPEMVEHALVLGVVRGSEVRETQIQEEDPVSSGEPYLVLSGHKCPQGQQHR